MDLSVNLPNLNIQILGISAHFNHVKGDWHYPKHHHDTFEFLFMLDGNGCMTVRDQAYSLRSGDGMLLRPNESHGFTVLSEEECRYFTFHFDVDDMQMRHLFCLAEEGRIDRSESSSEQFRNHIDSICRIVDLHPEWFRKDHANEPRQPDLEGKLRLQAEILSVLGALSGAMARKLREGSIRKDVTYRKAELAEALMQYMNDRLHSTVQVHLMAKQFNVSTSYCNQVFHSVYGISPRAYLSSRKLAETKRYLLETKMTVEQISEMLGFTSLAHFSRQFKRWTGMSPQLFRSNDASFKV